MVRRLRPATRLPYAAVHVNGPVLAPIVPAPGQDAGLLGRAFDPLLLGDVTCEPTGVAGLDPVADLPAVRLDARRSLLESLEGCRQAEESNRAARDMTTLYGEAYDLLAAPRFRRAFDLGQEPEAIRDRYGLHRSGQACLLGRRLVEAGVPLRRRALQPQDPRPGQGSGRSRRLRLGHAQRHFRRRCRIGCCRASTRASRRC